MLPLALVHSILIIHFVLHFSIFFLILCLDSLYPGIFAILVMMAVSGIISRFKPRAVQNEVSETTTPSGSASFVEKDTGAYDDSPVKYLTWRSFVLGILASMGGFIFGYSTGECLEISRYTIGVSRL